LPEKGDIIALEQPLELSDHGLGALVVGRDAVADEAIGNRQAVDDVDPRLGQQFAQGLSV
jgi:hypothetical protein